MATRVNASAYYGTHLPALMTCIGKTTGPVLELGVGLFSTPYLHYACMLAGRELVSYETDANWAKFFTEYGYPCDTHDFRIVDNWDAADLSGPWDVALVDQSPDDSRVPAILRLRDTAKYVVVHDADSKFDGIYHLSTVYPHFKYRKLWDIEYRKTVVLSNLVDLGNLWQ